MRRILKSVLGAIAILFAVAAAYLVAAGLGTIWTKDPFRAEASAVKTRTAYVLSNGYHTDIALAVESGAAPGDLPIQASDLPGGLRNVRYLVFGWGSEAAYTSLDAISDLSVGTILTALAYDRSVIHVLPFYGIPQGDGVYRLDLSEAQYRRLLGFILDTFKREEGGGGQLLPGVTQGYGDVFYHAPQRFSPFYTCNVWTADALRKAGIPMGHWTPFAQSVEWNLSRSPQ